jgi:tetratricopeptide (TPR) repeat protein
MKYSARQGNTQEFYMRSTLILALLSCCIVLTPYRSSLAQDKRIRKPASVTAETSDRQLDGLTGPVRRVRVEIAKISVKDGQFTEGPRMLRETTTYDPKGRKIDTVAHPVEGSTLPGKEEYRYDDNGNIVEMTLRGDDGSILSKESYKYELDEMGNWKKMTSSVAIYEDGKVTYEPIEVTYRTISYYFSQAVDKLVASNPKPDAGMVKSTAADTASSTPSVVVTNPPKTSGEKAHPAINKPVETSTGSKTADRSKAAETETAAVRKASETPKTTETPLEKVTAPTSTEVSAVTSSDRPKVTEKAADAPSEKPAANGETGAGVGSTSSKQTEPVKAVDTPTEKVAANNEAASDSISVPKPATSTVSEKPEAEKTTPPKVSEATTPANAATAAYEKGMSHLAALRYADAVKSFSESARLNPNDAQTYSKLGVAYSFQGHYTEAVAVLKMAIQIKREVVDAQGYYHLATAYAALGKHSNALDAFKQALYILRAESVDNQQAKTQNAPPLAHVYHGIGAMYYNLERYNDAIKELKRAIELNPKLADSYYVLALSYIAIGNRKTAENHRDTLKSLNPKLAGKIDAALSNQGTGIHCRTVFGPCQ